jgi:hypothetical protein
MKLHLGVQRRPACKAAILASASLAGLGLATSAGAQGGAASIIADQVRSQGFACEGPTSAKRDQSGSAPNQTVWVLTCKGASYRVVLVPDQAAVVTQLQ